MPDNAEVIISELKFPWTVKLDVDEEGDTIAEFTDAPKGVHLCAHGKDAGEALQQLNEVLKFYQQEIVYQKAAKYDTLRPLCEEMLAALRHAREHVLELADAWQTGALSEHDGRGGTRSNRNSDVRIELRETIQRAEATLKDGG